MSSSDKENDSRPSSSLYGNINKSEAQKKGSGDGFQYRTINGNVIRSVIPPGKGIMVAYKVSTFTCFAFFSASHVVVKVFYFRKLFLWLHNLPDRKLNRFISSSGTIKLLGPEALLVHSSCPECCQPTTGRPEEPIVLPTAVEPNMGSSVSRRASCAQASRACSRCLLISHLIYSKHTHFALSPPFSTFSV